MAETLKTSLNRKWLIKMIVFLIVLAAFGTWGLVDSIWIYPNRGLDDASFKQRAYLEAAERAGRLSTAAFPDPVTARATLEAKRGELEEAERKGLALESTAAQSTPEGQRAAADLRGLAAQRADYHALQWLDALARVFHLKPEATAIADPSKTLAELRETWKTRTPPKALASYDLPLQWFFTAIGYGGALWMLIHTLRIRGRVYAFEPDTQRLTLPGGRQLTPADIAEFDKRRWDKFYVYLQLKDGSPEIPLDMLPHDPLEDWILSMEDTAFPERAKERAEAEAKRKNEEEAATQPTEAGDKPA